MMCCHRKNNCIKGFVSSHAHKEKLWVMSMIHAELRWAKKSEKLPKLQSFTTIYRKVKLLPKEIWVHIHECCILIFLYTELVVERFSDWKSIALLAFFIIIHRNVLFAWSRTKLDIFSDGISGIVFNSDE